jgi:hypothetical protein
VRRRRRRGRCWSLWDSEKGGRIIVGFEKTMRLVDNPTQNGEGLVIFVCIIVFLGFEKEFLQIFPVIKVGGGVWLIEWE